MRAHPMGGGGGTGVQTGNPRLGSGGCRTGRVRAGGAGSQRRNSFCSLVDVSARPMTIMPAKPWYETLASDFTAPSTQAIAALVANTADHPPAEASMP